MKENFVVSQDFYLTNNFKSSLIQILFTFSYDFILLIYANGICQLYDLIDCKIIFQEKIVKNPKHLRISLHNYFFYSDPISNKIYYTPLKNPFETKRLDELPSKGFPNPFDNIFSSTIKPLQKEVLNEIYAESILKFAPFKDNEIVLLFETIGDTEKDYYINKISIYTIPEGKLLNQNSILSVDVLLHNYLKIIDDNFVVIFPLNQTFGEECPLNFYIIKIVDKKENEYKVVLIPSDLKGQLKGLNGYYSQGKLILCIFFIKNGLTENNVAFIEIDFQESENITSNVIRKILDIPQPNEFIFFYNEGNFKNEAISQLFKVMLKDGSSLFNLTRINYTTLEIEEIKSLEIERIIVNNPFNFRYSIEFDDESYKEDKLNKINQKYFKLHMIGCNQSIAFIFLLEKAKIMEKYGRHIVYEIIDFLI